MTLEALLYNRGRNIASWFASNVRNYVLKKPLESWRNMRGICNVSGLRDFDTNVNGIDY